MGFVEDAPVEIVHEGLFGRDPIAIKLADRTVALRDTWGKIEKKSK